MSASRPGGAADIRGVVTRKLLRQIASALQSTDMIAMTMVLVAALSAYATWKTEQVTNEIRLTSQRPYIGVESVHLVDAASPKVMADLRNFGSIQAEDAVIDIVLRVNGRALSLDFEPQRQEAPVVLSPSVPHHFYRHISRDTYLDAMKGKAILVVEIQVRYRGPGGDQHCYRTRDRYDPTDDFFYSQGGSLSCDRAAQSTSW